MKKFRLLVLVIITSGVLIALLLGGVRRLTSLRRESVMPRNVTPENMSELWTGLAEVAVPGDCPVSVRARGQVGWSSSEMSIALDQVEVENRSLAKLLVFNIDWDIYINGSESCPSQLAVRCARKPFSCILAGGSQTVDVKFSHSSTAGFKTISGKLTYAEFADGTTCGKEQKMHTTKASTNCREGFMSAYNF